MTEMKRIRMKINMVAYFIVTKNEVLWDVECFSHDVLIKKYRLNYNSDSYVPTMIIPFDYNFKKSTKEWEYIYLKENLPIWYNNESHELMCRYELEKWIDLNYIRSGNHIISGKIHKVVVGGNVTINNLEGYNSEIIIYGKSKVEINNMSNGMVYFNDNSIGIINNQIGGDIYFNDNSIGTVNNRQLGNISFRNNSTGFINKQTVTNTSFRS